MNTPSRQDLVTQRYITARPHPTEPLLIFNYSPRAAVDRLWNEHTLECRGLIIHAETNEVVARPYRKFFNLGEPLAEMPERYVVADKLDGSLGIAYRLPSTGEIAIATRGSFASEQAIHATAVWKMFYSQVQIPDGQTWLFEIIYPENRIVLNYGDLDDLILHGVIDTVTGADLPLPSSDQWPGKVVDTYEARPVEQLPVRPNAEGYVLVEDPLPLDRPAKRIKLKHEEYKRLHKLIDGLTPHRIWDCLAHGGDFKAMLDGVPDETFNEAEGIAESFRSRARQLEIDSSARWQQIKAEDPNRTLRKDFALRILDEPEELRSLLFLHLSNKPVIKTIWERIEP